MISTILTPRQQSHLALLRTHFGSSGALSGTDLLSGQRYDVLYPADPTDFFTAHLLGPGRRRMPAEVAAKSKAGEANRFASFFRSQVRPLDDERSTSTISLTLTGQAGLEPSPEVCSVVQHLQAAGFPVVVERSFRIMRWTLWTFLVEPVREASARSLAYEQYCMIRDGNPISPDLVEAPLIDESADQPHLPHQFFAGEFFGMLYQLHGDKLRPLDLSAVPHLDPFAEKCVMRSFVDDEAGRSLDAVLAAWWKRFEGRRVRSGELLDTLESLGISIDSLIASGDSHRRSIELGLYLKGLEPSHQGRWAVRSRRSGHGTVFWLVKGTGVCSETAGADAGEATP